MHGFDVIFFEFFLMVEKPKADTSVDENEIQITSQGRMRNYITYAMSLLHVFLSVGFFFFFFEQNVSDILLKKQRKSWYIRLEYNIQITS